MSLFPHTLLIKTVWTKLYTGVCFQGPQMSFQFDRGLGENRQHRFSRNHSPLLDPPAANANGEQLAASLAPIPRIPAECHKQISLLQSGSLSTFDC